MFDEQTFSNLLGLIELATALLLALAPVVPIFGLCGGALAAGTFALTSTFLITGPAWELGLGGFPALSPAGGFLIKDLALLGIALAVVGRSLVRLDRAGAGRGAGQRARAAPDGARPREA